MKACLRQSLPQGWTDRASPQSHPPPSHFFFRILASPVGIPEVSPVASPLCSAAGRRRSRTQPASCTQSSCLALLAHPRHRLCAAAAGGITVLISVCIEGHPGSVRRSPRGHADSCAFPGRGCLTRSASAFRELVRVRCWFSCRAHNPIEPELSGQA